MVFTFDKRVSKQNLYEEVETNKNEIEKEIASVIKNLKCMQGIPE